MKMLCRWGWAAVVAVVLAGCKPQGGATQQAVPAGDGGEPQADVAAVMVDTVNYQHDRGARYTLYDLSGGKKTAVGGDIADPLASGGAKNCCVSLPQVWKPGMKLLLEWQEGDFERTYPERYSKELEIPRYEQPADLYVVFYPQHDVELVVSFSEPGHPQWAGRVKQTPWNACVEQVGRKVCKAALPKTGLSLDEMRGFCNSDTLEPGQCERLLEHCVADYEDRDMCTKLVWETKK